MPVTVEQFAQSLIRILNPRPGQPRPDYILVNTFVAAVEQALIPPKNADTGSINGEREPKEEIVMARNSNDPRKVASERVIGLGALDRRIEKAYPARAPKQLRPEPKGYISPDPRPIPGMRPQPDLHPPGPGYSAKNWPQRNPPPRKKG